MKKKTILTGDRPTGPLHIGHYFGSLINRQKLQSEYETYLMIADVQALTDHWDRPQKVKENILEVAADNMSLGLLPETTLFIQSQIPQIAELTVFYSNLITVNRLKHNPTVKAELMNKQEQFGAFGESVSFGFLGYPVSQAADITILRAHTVPVGADQLPMIELAREIVEKFHRAYNTEIFPLPEAVISQGQRIQGLDGQAKMSKSLNNCLYLKDSENDTLKKIKSAKTDSLPELGFDPENRPALSNLITIYGLLHQMTPQDVVSELKGIRYGEFKIKLANDLNQHLAPMREKRQHLMSHPHLIMEKLEEGRSRVLKKAEETIRLVKSAMHLII